MRLKEFNRETTASKLVKAKHDIDFGIRYHEDQDRRQWIDGYAIQNGVMNRTSNGTQEQMPINYKRPQYILLIIPPLINSLHTRFVTKTSS
jgi:hypothetical protein